MKTLRRRNRRIVLLSLLLPAVLGACAAAWAQTPPPAPPPPPPPPPAQTPPATRPPLPKLPSGARGFDPAPGPSKAAPKLIAVGGGWGAEEDPKKPTLKSPTARGYFALGQEYLTRLDFDKAIAPLEKAVQLDPNYLEAFKALGEAYAYSGVSAQDDRPDPDFLQRRYRQSAGAFEQARRLAPKEADLCLDLGVLYFDTAQYPKAIDAFREGLRLYPADKEFEIPILEYVTRTDVHSFLGQSYVQLGMDDKAAAAFEEGLRADPDDPKDALCWELGPLYERAGSPEKALAVYTRLVAEGEAAGERPDGKALVRIAALEVRAGENGKAAAALVKAVSSFEAELAEHERYPPEPDAEADWKKEWGDEATRLRAQVAEASYDLGTVRLALEQPGEALAPLRRAVELAPDHAGARFDLGFASLALGDRETARTQVEALRGAAPDLAKELEERLGR